PREMLDPPAFSPENGRHLREGDREQEITYATNAQFPVPVEEEKVKWQSGIGEYLQYSYGVDQLLVVANKGKDEEGFIVCESCGAAWLSGEQPPGDSHQRPFLIEKYILDREQTGYKCNGQLHPPLYLGHAFRTDLLLLRIHFGNAMDFRPEQPWLYDA